MLVINAPARYVASMSEYQYYEFLAIDRPLTEKEQRELRAISTRAMISATRFRNEYQWGDLKADPTKLLARYFDAHVYVTNWGIHRFALRFPKELVDVKAWRLYCASPCLTLHEQGEYVLLDFEVQEEAPDYEADPDGYMPALVPIRQMLLRGDLRALYLGWLASVQAEAVRDTKGEPPVPPGLKDLRGSLDELCDFLLLDQDHVSVAAGASSSEVAGLPEGLTDFITALAESEKTRILIEIAEGKETNPAALPLKLFRNSQSKKNRKPVRTEEARSVGELQQQAAEVRSARLVREEEAQKRAAQKAEKERAAARARQLDSLEGHEEELWTKADPLIELKKPKAYAEAISILRDLRDLAERDGTKSAFRERIAALLERHRYKQAFLSRVKEAALMR